MFIIINMLKYCIFLVDMVMHILKYLFIHLILTATTFFTLKFMLSSVIMIFVNFQGFYD